MWALFPFHRIETEASSPQLVERAVEVTSAVVVGIVNVPQRPWVNCFVSQPMFLLEIAGLLRRWELTEGN